MLVTQKKRKDVRVRHELGAAHAWSTMEYGGDHMGEGIGRGELA